MTHNIDSTVLVEAMELLIKHGIAGFMVLKLFPYQRRQVIVIGEYAGAAQ